MKLSAIGMMMLMLSCAASRTEVSEPWSISVTSSGGLAGRGAGSFAIESDGDVAVHSMMDKRCTYRATGEELARFRELLADARPETWKDSYLPKESCCDRFEYEMTIDEAGKKRTVRWIDDPDPMPADLAALTNAMVGPPPSLRVTYGGQCR